MKQSIYRPSFSLALGRVSLELDPQGAFLRAWRLEAYARMDRQGQPAWGWHREPAALEVTAGRLLLTVSRASPP